MQGEHRAGKVNTKEQDKASSFPSSWRTLLCRGEPIICLLI